MNSPDPGNVLALIEAFRRSQAMFTAVELGVFDLLERAPATASALARETSTHEGALTTLLDTCAALGLLEKQQEFYRNTPEASAYLCRASAHSMTGYVLYSNRVLYSMWRHLEQAVREGTNRWQQTFGMEGPIFAHFFRTPEALRTFIHGMHGFGMLSSPAVVTAFDLSRYRHLADLGGGTGHLAAAACARYPQLSATVYDLPAVAEVAAEYLSAHPAGRITIQPGDFFSDPLPEADLYSLGRILHDWTEEKILQLLRRIYERLPSGGALLIAEKLIEEDHCGPASALLQSLNMLVCTEGRERSLSEYAALLRAAGFPEVEGKRTGTPLDAILAVKS